MVLYTSGSTIKISKNVLLLHYIQNNFLHAWTLGPTNLLAHQNITINRFKASKTIWTNQQFCYAQLDQGTETLLGPATNNQDQAIKCGLI